MALESMSINGAEIKYRLIGPENAPLIITLHGGRGFGDHVGDFTAFSPLADEYRVLSYDMRGHGQSSVTGPFTFQQLVEDIDGIRQHFLGAEGKVIILGGSFGGYLAQQYAIQYAQHVSHLILRGTAPSYHHEDSALKVLLSRLDRAPLVSPEMLVDGVFGAFKSDEEFRLVIFAMGPLYSETYDPYSALQRNLQIIFRAKVHNDLYSQEEKFFDYRDKLKNITAKSLVIVGEFDWICPPEQSDIIVERIPVSRLLKVPNANHSVHLEKGELVLGAIRSFLKE
ncbi:Alpha/Beta hydrolase protein [Bisporella sp. PMI_857]|nr:Alpha/Beta hydrolase protein [Bisporella sp. PMI_857]